MAEGDDAQEKTESATPKRLEEARRKGQIPRSRDLSAAAVTMSAAAALYMMGDQIAGKMSSFMERSLTLTREQSLDSTQMIPMLTSAALDGLKMCAPVLGIICLAAILAPLALGGWSFSTEALMPQFNRLNPLEGVKRIFSMRAVVELIKALAKFGIVGLIAVIVLWNDVTTLLNLGQEPLHQAIAHTITLSGKALIAITAGLLIIAGIDVPYQLYTYAKQLKMSRQEIREEHKESEGSPEVKGRIRQLQQQFARQRMMQDVPKADVIVTNPTHFAVALRYDEKRMRAPIVVAKGVDLVAARIREVATEHNVPIFEAPPLARVLYRNVDIGGEIPATVYQAVAQVLTYVFQLRVARRSGFQPPPRPDVTVEE
ncbi:flagellar biosynthesis protein FlhB [Steroidobacter agaridevorans]|uniref:Flagellar biosynthetic protein FlhB n=1 Tax=Steroidobacter agaridevorans TaxID=2695856 RepID=A0A829YJ45_9GAMM|nr:flagellar biosynthesis protein FlhB [Steroidobacter agaridevorans]GFE83199.1 flagellar biosynthesis protein FlhB [Steroidobacter agaridevorans]GFE86280.1 flagellar biosynthesis protein FlhB [Steroidobacter agaridevorans]